MEDKRADRLFEDIHSIQMNIVRLTSYVESELGTSATPGNIHRQLNILAKDIKDVKETLQSENGHGARIKFLENKDEVVNIRVSSIEKWKNERDSVASNPQFKELANEVESQKKKWVMAVTLFTLAQFLIGLAIKLI